jgi:hypothetical protein
MINHSLNKNVQTSGHNHNDIYEIYSDSAMLVCMKIASGPGATRALISRYPSSVILILNDQFAHQLQPSRPAHPSHSVYYPSTSPGSLCFILHLCDKRGRALA